MNTQCHYQSVGDMNGEDYAPKLPLTPRPHTTERGEGRASMELLAGVHMYRGVVCVCVCVGEWLC